MVKYNVNNVNGDRFLRLQVQREVFESRSEGPLLEILRNLLRQVPLRSVWNLRKQGRVPLLQGLKELQGRPQVPLTNSWFLSPYWLFPFVCPFCVVKLYVVWELVDIYWNRVCVELKIKIEKWKINKSWLFFSRSIIGIFIYREKILLLE